MNILMVDPSQAKLPVSEDLIRADTYISIPLAEELAKRGHKVSFLTSKDSLLSLPQLKVDYNALFSVIPVKEFYEIEDPELMVEFTKSFFASILLKCRELAQSGQFDIIHIHSNYYLLELSMFDSVKNTPIAVTLHSHPTSKHAFSSFISQYNLSNTHFVSISNKQREAFPYSFFDTAYNGVDTSHFSFDQNGGEAMLFSGRLRQIKGIKEALKLSVETGRKLRFVGKTNTDTQFVNNEVLPYVSGYPQLISHLEQINRSTIPSFYQQGKLTLFPIQWEEPFGLVQIESMACGTPLVAYAQGSVPEVIKDGVTGFIVNASENDIRGDWIIKKTGMEGLKEAVERIYSLSDVEYKQMRRDCREHIEKNFSMSCMTDKYEQIYERILKNKSSLHG